ncbi:ABC transporter permease [Clostridium cellulovorans]|uniref:Inner-membrane translocator n=1 Tax=Clostridium cellulovorans (strain ATCC 35296 / DSM 3052 / OCM 3 / 743B) TaxID=573061 RepID=D9SRW7_CLOC7|nr:ABC transporter permease [Clostridium cellulovorans]ADL50484.1 inner-membrane translocator [Clostridium cellulovorans 743B]
MSNIDTSKQNRMASVKGLAKSIGVPVASILVALLASAIFVVWSTGENYFSAVGILLKSIAEGSLGSLDSFSETLAILTPLLFAGLAQAIAFKTGLFNIGVEGQFIVGMMGATIVGLIPGIPGPIHIVLVILAGVAAGGFWAFIPGYLKAVRGTNEVVNTIMMNFIALYLCNYLVMNKFTEAGQSATDVIQGSAQLFRFLGPSNRANIGVFLALLTAVLVYFLLNKTKAGFELRAVGLSPTSAEYGGVSIKKNIVLAMVISGVVAGLGGATYISGVQHQMLQMAAFPNFGFDGMTVALIAKSNPIAAILSAFLIAALNSSQLYLQMNNIPKEIISLIQAIIIIFLAADYTFKFLKRKKKGAAVNG